MCFHSKQSKTAQQVANRFKTKNEVVDTFFQSDNIDGFTFPKTPVITESKQLEQYQWGLIPSWSTNDLVKKFTLNARIETLSEKPSFKDVIHQRCLVVADGFYEWQWLDHKGKNKQKYLITLPDDGLFAFGGLWSSWTNPITQEKINSYTIVTTEANELMAEIHNSKKRMPVILNKDNEQAWLTGHSLNDFYKPQIELKANKIIIPPKSGDQISIF